MTGDPHLDARLEPWRPRDRRNVLPDRLPEPGRERGARIALTVLMVIAAGTVIGYLAIAIVSSGVVGTA